MAELLVKAKVHWMDSLKQDDIDKLNKYDKRGYDARTNIGDVIAVRPDGWTWGKCECLPDYIVVKVPNVKEEDLKYLEDHHKADVDVAVSINIDKTTYDDVDKRAKTLSQFNIKGIPSVISISANEYKINMTCTENIIKKMRRYKIDHTKFNFVDSVQEVKDVKSLGITEKV
jgi:hypothetical protein